MNEQSSDSACESSGLGEQGRNLSIIIPTYNCARYLHDTLAALEREGDSISKAQIMVVDDCSAKDDPQQVISEHPVLNIEFFRHPVNVGPIRNFNYCVQAAKRQWVHILHGDDMVQLHAYTEIQNCLNAFPETQAIFGRSMFVDKDGAAFAEGALLGTGQRGIYRCRVLDWSFCPVQFAGVVVDRDAYRLVGPFDESYVHVADWNMWWRLAQEVRVTYTNEFLGQYRVFEGNHSSTLMRSGRNMREMIRQLKIQAATLHSFGERQRLYHWVTGRIARQTRDYYNDNEAFWANLKNMMLLPPGVTSTLWCIRLLIARFRKRHGLVRGSDKGG